MVKAIFVTGTDTEVGKTVITRALVRALVNRGMTVRAVKPVESGAPVVNGKLLPRDALALKQAAKRDGDVTDIYAYAFPDWHHGVRTKGSIVPWCIPWRGAGKRHQSDRPWNPQQTSPGSGYGKGAITAQLTVA